MGTVKCSQAFEDCIGIVYHYQDIIILCVRIVSFERTFVKSFTSSTEFMSIINVFMV